MERPTEESGSVNDKEWIFESDREFKEIIHNSNVFSMVLRECVSHFHGMDIEDIKPYLELSADGKTVSDLNVEIRNENSQIRLDSLFRVRIPTGGVSAIFVGVEGQQYHGRFPEVLDRAIEYTASEITRQRGVEFSERDGNSLRDVWSIWIMMNPKLRFRNSIVEYGLTGRIRSSKAEFNVLQSTRLNIVFVNIGAFNDGLPEDIGILSAMFYPRMSYAERKAVMDKYKFPLDEFIHERVSNMYSMAQDTYDYAYREASESHVRALMENGYSMEDAFEVLKMDERMRSYIRRSFEEDN